MPISDKSAFFVFMQPTNMKGYISEDILVPDLVGSYGTFYLLIVWQNFRTEIVFTAEKELPNTMLLEICPDLWSVLCACLHV